MVFNLIAYFNFPGCHHFVSPDLPRSGIPEATETCLEATLPDRTIIIIVKEVSCPK
jgi:hypothetical protein